MNFKELLLKPINGKLNGIPIPIFLLMAVTSPILMRSGVMEKTGLIGSFTFMLICGMIFFAIGEKLPIWNRFIGGGYVMAFLGGSLMVKLGLIPTTEANIMIHDAIGNRFLYFCLILLIGGNLLSVNRKTLMKSILGYVPLILFSVAGASAMGILGGMLFGIPASKIITMYVLPIMGGGNGAGAIPMAEIYESVTGIPQQSYYSFAISILTLANIIAIVFAALLNLLGEKFPSLTGNGKLMKEDDNSNLDIELEQAVVTKSDHFGAIYLTFGVACLSFILYALCDSIHVFAYVVLIFLLLNFIDILSIELKLAMIQVMNFGLKLFIPLVLFAVGLGTNLQELIDAISLSNVILCIFIVVGAILGAMLPARLFKFYEIEAALTAGLCMANRGGSGDLEILGAAKRMELYPFAQISSRIGGGMILVLAGYLFSILL